MKIFFSVFLAIIAAFAVMRLWDAYGDGVTVLSIALAVLVGLVVLAALPFVFECAHAIISDTIQKRRNAAT